MDLESALKLADAGDLVLIDVRPREEFDAGHLPNAKSMPLECIERMLPDLPADKLCAAYCGAPTAFLRSARRASLPSTAGSCWCPRGRQGLAR